MNLENVKFLWASEELVKHADTYWPRVMDIARKNTISRIRKCATIMGRKEEDDMCVAMYFYPCMQCADIFHLKADICQLGVDQRKVNMLAREYCDDIQQKEKPIILSHRNHFFVFKKLSFFQKDMLSGLKEGKEKMSKSDPDSSIFMEDTEEEVKNKIKKAFCPEKQVENNPCLEYAKYIVFESFESVEVNRLEKYGGNL